MTRKTVLAAALLVALALGHPALAFPPLPPSKLEVRSENGRYELHLPSPWGSPSPDGMERRVATVYRIEGDTRARAWQTTLSDRLVADTAFISNDGESFVTWSWGIRRENADLLAFHSREGQRNAYAVGALLLEIADIATLVDRVNARDRRRPVTAEVLTQRLEANNLGYLRNAGLISHSYDFGYRWFGATMMHLDEHKGKLFFCMWLEWANGWTAWDVSTGRKVAATEEMVERWNAKAMRRAGEALKQPYALSERAFLAWLSSPASRSALKERAQQLLEDMKASGELSPKDEFAQWLDRCQTTYDRLEDYTCMFVQRERIGDKLLPEELALVKFRKPVMVYMKWVGEVKKGQECIYVEGRHDGKLVAHGTGLAGIVTLKLDPEGRTAMRNRRHPITDAGIGNLLKLLQADYQLAARHDEGRVGDKGTERLSGRELRVFECILPADKRPGYYCHRAVVGFDTVLVLPVSVSIYDAEDRLLEHYRYEDLELDVGLTEKDFDKDNPDYGF